MSNVTNYCENKNYEQEKGCTTIIKQYYGCGYKDVDLHNIPQLSLVLTPHLWMEGVEVDLCDGSYGRRFTGVITATPSITMRTELLHANVTLLDSGGIWGVGSTTRMPVGNALMQTGGNVPVYVSSVFTTPDFIAINTFSILTRTGDENCAYDVWIRYTK